MHPDHENLPLPVQQRLRRIAIGKCVACAVLVVCGIVLLFTPEVPSMPAATIAGAGVVGVALFGSQLMRRATPDTDD